MSLLALFLSALPAEPHNPRDEAKSLDEIVVQATPLRENAAELLKPAEVLRGEALESARAGTLGETLRELPGVQSTQFGQAVARPIIRGLDGARVLVAQGGVSAMDVSTLSVDHAVSVEPFLADQIEVLKGPGALLFGSGVIGGVVNVEDGRLPERLPERATGRAQLQGGSNSDETNAVLRLDAPAGSIALHMDAFHRKAENYEAPEAEVANTDLQTNGAALGGSWISENGHFGVGLSRYEANYGIPLEEARIDLAQTRVDAHGGIGDLPGFVERVEFRLGANNYRHLELEVEDEQVEIGTRFDNDEAHLRVDATHASMGNWRGAFGFNAETRDVKALGEEAFVPDSKTRSSGVFLIERMDGDVLDASIGARWDRQRISSETGERRSFSVPNLSLAFGVQANEQLRLTASADLATRAPQAEELYSDGPHAATQTFEIGDANLRTERARNFNLGAKWNIGRFSLQSELYRTQFQRFTYLQSTDEVQDDLPVFLWDQRDATFTGFELATSLKVLEQDEQSLEVQLLADRVRATFDDDSSNLPRISPARVGAKLNYRNSTWHASLGGWRYRAQNRVAEFETTTPGFTQIDMDINYLFEFDEQSAEVYLQANNLSDQNIRLHTSFLKDEVVLPGRNIQFGVRWFF